MSAHPLRARIEQESRAAGVSLGELTVLAPQRDPYRLDTPAMHRDGRWLAEQIARLAVKKVIHLRGLHYVLVAAADAIKPDGTPYVNSDADWTWLSEGAAKVARWLGYIPFDRVIDERNEAPAIFVPEAVEPEAAVYCTFDWRLPDPEDLVPVAALNGFRPRQPFRLVLCGEKTSLRSVLEPIARAHGAELVLPTGEMSDTLIKGIADRAVTDGRPLVVQYYSDFDPSGWQMPVSVARKLQALRDLMPDLPPIQLHPVALLPEHVADLGLPSTPLKQTEQRADGWRAQWGGLEQTEIDALAALRPAELAKIARAALRPFYDYSLDRRASEAESAWHDQANLDLRQCVNSAWLVDARRRLEERLAEIVPELERLQRDLTLDMTGIALSPAPEVEPDVHGLPSAPEPLWSSELGWAEGTRRLVARKAYAKGKKP
jgi:hypothetical protein